MESKKQQTLAPDYDMAQKHLTLLDEEADQFTFQLFIDEKVRYDATPAKSRARKFNGTLEQHWKTLASHNSKGWGVYVTVNETDLRGRKLENIKACRSIWRENDRLGLPELPIEPNLVVETSPGHCHEYLLTSTADFEQWSGVMQTMVDEYGSDPGAKDLARVLRLAGFYHMKDPENPHQVRIVHENCAVPYEWAEICGVIPPTFLKVSAPKDKPDPEDLDLVEIKDALKSLDPDMEYRLWLKVGTGLHHGFSGNATGLQLWDEWSQGGASYKPGECAERWGTFGNYGGKPTTLRTIFDMAYEAGWQGGRKKDQQGGEEQQQAEENSKTKQIIKMVLQMAELKLDPESNVYAAVMVDGIRLFWPIGHSMFKRWLQGMLYYEAEMTVSAAVYADVLNSLAGIATAKGEEVQVSLRVAAVEDEETGAVSYYLDLCDKHWRTVRIDEIGWEVKKSIESPYFRRTQNMHPLPAPLPTDPELLPEMLGKYLHLPQEKDIYLVIAFLLECLRPNTHYPCLELTGPPGSGKSFAMEVVRSLLDPNKVILRSAPLNAKDFFVGAANSYMMTLNNLSTVKDWLSDGICILATGGGYQTRTLYTTLDETSVDVQRPVVFNGVEVLSVKPDLIDRAIRFQLPMFEQGKNRSDKELRQEFRAERPQLLGALLNLLVEVLKEIPTTTLPDAPRLRDFGILCEALTKVYKVTPSIAELYISNRDSSFYDILQQSPTLKAVMDIVDQNNGFRGTIGELFRSIKAKRTFEGGEDEPFVKSEKGLANRIRYAAGALKSAGYQVKFDPVRKNDGWHIIINKTDIHYVHNVHQKGGTI